ncbi:MAG: endopeptidase La [Clostridia bacterium]|nr:endopeptidase La [Clostridia bacterium]
MASFIEKAEKKTLPVIALRGLVIFPGMPVSFEITRKQSVLAMQAASSFGESVFLTLQKDIGIMNPTISDVESFGCIATIKQATKLHSGNYRLIVEGTARGEIVEEIKEAPYLKATVISKEIRVSEVTGTNLDKKVGVVKKLFEQLVGFMPKISPELVAAVQSINVPELLADFIGSNVIRSLEDKQSILEVVNPVKRLDFVIEALKRELEIIKLEYEIHMQTKEGIDRNQREYFLREQLKVIQRELGMGEEGFDEDGEPIPDDDVNSILERIKKSSCPKEVKDALRKETLKLNKMPPISSESAVIREYVDTVMALPWDIKTVDSFDVEKAKKVLDADHDALTKVKDRILEYISVKQLAPELKGQILLLVGPPGVGKTSVAKSIARAMNRKFVRVSLGGIRDEAEIRGHRKTYVAAMPGRIVTALKQVGTQNPVMLLDEIDKMTKDNHGDPAAALLEVLDIDQNKTFRDHYVEFPFDISDCIFIATANTLDTVPRPLLDRMEIIKLPAYTESEKIDIFKNHLLPKELRRHGLNGNKLRVKDEAIAEIIQHYTKESGVRNLERETAALCRKVARKLVEADKKSYTIKKSDIKEYLGNPKIRDMKDDTEPKIGIVNGLAWTEVGGEMLQVEVLSMPGTGKVEVTGSLGDVMKESARAAVSYIRKNAEKLGVDKEFYKNLDIHIHFPEGAVPKDGPSAGVTMTTALVSELSGRRVRGDVAMTGEITLSGRVFPIGGLREKTMAAYKHGMKTVVVPEDNRIDIEECDKLVLDNIEFVYASDISTVLETALVKE